MNYIIFNYLKFDFFDKIIKIFIIISLLSFHASLAFLQFNQLYLHLYFQIFSSLSAFILFKIICLSETKYLFNLFFKNHFKLRNQCI